MKILSSIQTAELSDAVRAKFAMIVPVIEATLHSLSKAWIERLGGLDKITLADISRAFKKGDGDAGICFEYAVHDAIARSDKLIHTLASEVLSKHCKIKDGASSILFGPEKNGTIPILESTENALTDDSRIYVGNRGQPPKLKQYIPQIVSAFRRNEERSKLPRSIRGLWKADLFLGSPQSEAWVGTTIKINPTQLEGAQGLRIGIYPRVNSKDGPRLDKSLNLIRLPLPYDAAFMELFYKSFFLVRAFMKADAVVPKPVDLPDAADRYVTQELEARREFPIIDVVETIRDMGQQNLLQNEPITDVAIDASLSEAEGLKKSAPPNTSQMVSLAPKTREG